MKLMNKKLILILTAVFLSFSGIIEGQNIDYDKMLKMKGVTSIFLSESMIKMMPKGRMIKENVDFSGIAEKLTGIYIFTSENEQATAELKKTFSPMLVTTSKKFETLMFVKEDNSLLKLISKKQGNLFEDLYMLIDEKEDFVAIILRGKFEKKDLDKIISQSH
ncbi:DUF4252 domain-containing protein [Porphyromonas macacae]|uniref:DUF4252 domain-containing protein n=1 Tax=Porphyromonas macacae TaxID=28115 RepID=A0A379DIP0_9PORP|nr:DUF4252 domain-containing protein [Porphyromonas macacae]SUB78032.1 Uncharacterised protein [Porphyromonas macacae]